MSRFWDVVGSHWDKAGQTEASFGPDGVTLQDAVSTRQMTWAAIDAIKARPGLTVLRSGISMTVVPDAALPDGMSGKTFRARLNGWKNA